MTTDRAYRAAMALGDALEELRAHRGTQFDPDVVDQLLAMHVDSPGRTPPEKAVQAKAPIAP
jgi:HD-GYP domain-containing protein (c-di-GMP phosphodiesterase class II)